jgi:hypothetical protein
MQLGSPMNVKPSNKPSSSMCRTTLPMRRKLPTVTGWPMGGHKENREGSLSN